MKEVRKNKEKWRQPLALLLAAVLLFEGIFSTGLEVNAAELGDNIFKKFMSNISSFFDEENEDKGIEENKSISKNDTVSENDSISENDTVSENDSISEIETLSKDNSISENDGSGLILDGVDSQVDDVIPYNVTDANEISGNDINYAVTPSKLEYSAAQTYQVRFVVGNYANPVPVISIKEGVNVSLDSVLPDMNRVESAYEFSAWYWDAAYKNKLTSSQKRKAVKENITLYAKYLSVKRQFAITYHLDGGKNGKNPLTYNVEDSFTLAVPTKRGFLFEGWYRDAAFTQPMKSVSTGSYGRLNLFAKWKKIEIEQVKITSLKNSTKGKVVVKYNKIQDISGYEVQFATSKKFGKRASNQLSKSTKVTLTNMLAKKTYYIRVRAYKIDSTGEKYYGKYSSVKSIKIKRGVTEVKATSSSAKITAFKINGENEVTIKASVKKRIKSKDEHYYLFILNPGSTKISKSAKPLATFGKTATVTTTLPLAHKEKKSLLFSPIGIGIKVKGGYQLISKAAYLSNPQKIAKDTRAYPKQPSKKGLQTSGEYLEDAQNLGVNHVLFNVDLADVFSWKGEQNTVPYAYKGKTYYFKDTLSHPLRVQYAANDISISLVVLLSYRDDLTYLITPTARERGHHYYALNTTSKKSTEALEAAFCFLTESFQKNDVYISDWILGNEINVCKGTSTWNYAGRMSLSSYMNSYTDAFQMLYTAVTSTSANQRVFLSLDHDWTRGSHGFGGKEILDTFAKTIKSKNKYVKWNIAYHAYSFPLTSPAFWNSSVVTNKTNTPYITFKNLNVLTKYVKRNFGSKTRIILSEQGFTSSYSEQTQAAAIAFSYYLAEFNSMIDAVIYRSHIDNDVESSQGLEMGLWSHIPGTNRGRAKKKAWTVYKYMDTPNYEKHTKFALKVIKKSSWKKAVPGFKSSRFK